MKKGFKKSRYLRLSIDILFLFSSFFLAMLLSTKARENHDVLIPITLAFVWYFTSKYTNLYDEFRTTSFINELLTIIPNIIFQLIVLGFIYFAINEHDFSRTISLFYITIFFVLLIVKKYFFKQWKLHSWVTGLDNRNLLIIGQGEQGKAIYEVATNNKQFGYIPIGFVHEDDSAKKTNDLGSVTELENIIQSNKVDEIIISLKTFDSQLIQKIIRVADKNAIRTKIVPEFFQLYSSKFKMETFGHLPILSVREEPLEEFHWYFLKILLDIIFTLFLFLFVFVWLFPIIALAIKIDSKGPIFFIQERWGKDGKVFKCYKFRTMVHNAQTTLPNGRFNQTTKNDSRITKVGLFLRKTNFDELPQFINVIIGDMSVIGPRPHAVQHSIESKEQIENYLVRHLIKPGITGWAQVNGYRGETSDIFLMKKRVEFDIWYIENWTPWLDLKILLMTFYSMLKGDKMAY